MNFSVEPTNARGGDGGEKSSSSGEARNTETLFEVRLVPWLERLLRR